MKRLLTLILVGCVLIIGILFAVFNAQSISVNFIFGRAEMPLVVLMVLSLLLGILIGLLVMSWKVLKLHAQIHSLKSKLKVTEDKAREQHLIVKGT